MFLVVPIACFESQGSTLSGYFIIHTCLLAILTCHLIRNTYCPSFIMQSLSCLYLIYQGTTMSPPLTKYYSHKISDTDNVVCLLSLRLTQGLLLAGSFWFPAQQWNRVFKNLTYTWDTHTYMPLPFMCHYCPENLETSKWYMISDSSMVVCLQYWTQ